MIILRILLWLVLFPTITIGLDPILDRLIDGPNYTVGTLWLVAMAIIAWIIAGLPFRRVRRNQQLARAFAMLHPTWTPAQIASEVRLYRH